MKAKTFKLGDVVKLKAGGPKMVVEELPEIAQVVRCAWFSGFEKKSANFYVHTLVRG
jgi:uncharacterized protein YodC (DUF2158 family)